MWDHTSLTACLFVNAHLGKGKRARTPEDFHPLRVKRGNSGGIPLTAANIGMLRVFVHGKRDTSG